jgi:hypothetical protein
MGYGCFLPRAGYAAFFEQVPEKHIPGGDLLERLADHDHPKTRRDKRERASGPVRFLNDSRLETHAQASFQKPIAIIVSGHHKPASKGRNDPAMKICLNRHFSSKQARINSLMSGLFERKMPLFS